MKKPLLIISCFAAMAFTSDPETGFVDIIADRSAAVSYSTQYGNTLNCYTKAVLNLPGVASAFKVGFYLSTDTIIETTDILVGSFNVSSLSGSSPSVSGSALNINLATKSVPTGTYYVGAFVDYENAVAENGMTPEIDNNGWAFRNSSGTMTVVHYPGLDVGIKANELNNQIEKTRTAEGELVLSIKNGEEMQVEVYDLSGKLIQKEKGNRIILMPRNQTIYLINIKTSRGNFQEKLIL